MKNVIFIAACRTGHNFIMNQVQSWLPESKLVNYESILAEDYNRTLHQWIKAGQIDDDYRIFPVLIIRDLLNWWASYLKYVPTVAEKNHQNLFNIWVSHTREAFGLTNHIQNKIVVNYDQFNTKLYQREWLCDHVGGVYNEDRIDQVLEAGKGSSFDGRHVPGRLMGTGLRYHFMLDNKYWKEMLRKNPDALQLYRDNFYITDRQTKVLNQL